MKKHLSRALALALVLLCACGPKEGGSDSSSAPAGMYRPPAAGDLLPPEASASSSAGEPVPELPKPDLEVLTQWRGDYRYDVQCLNRTLTQLAGDYELASYFRWPDGREQVYMDALSLRFSGPASQTDSVCAAVALDLHKPTTVEELRTQWGESLVFQADDPVAGPNWTAADGSMRYHFRTDATGQTLLANGLGGNLVLAMDDLLADAPAALWTPIDEAYAALYVEEPSALWSPLLTQAQALDTSALPAGAVPLTEQEALDLFYAMRGAENPDTGVRYFSSDERPEGLWDSVAAPASLLLGDPLPADQDAVMSALNTPFNWNSYGATGYWFYLGPYKILLTSDLQGRVDEDSYFLVTWGDNAGF